jgi:hypothetical protein
MKISHNKYKNSGILFELLVRQITADTLSGKDSPAVDILKKYFIKSELSKEYKLYETLLKNTCLTEGKADIVLNTVLESSKKLNRTSLKKEKYNLIKEIKSHYNLEEFFKTKLPNYKTQAALYTLVEMYANNVNNTDVLISNKITIFEHLISKPSTTETKDKLIEEFSSFDKDTRTLSYKFILNKFNTKYSTLNSQQKTILKEYINSVDNGTKLRDFYNTQLNTVKISLTTANKTLKDTVTKIKINEVIGLMNEVDKSHKVKTEDIVNLLQYCELLNEVKKVKLN